MATRQEKCERKAKILLFVVITIVVMATKEITKVTVINNLVYSAFLWAVLWFLYVFVRDLDIALGWKKPGFPLPQYEREDMEMDRTREEIWNDLTHPDNIDNPASVNFPELFNK